MSDLLSGLYSPLGAVSKGDEVYDRLLWESDVAEALRNPTDETVEAIAEWVECSCVLGSADTCPFHGATQWMVRAVLAAAAGGDDE